MVGQALLVVCASRPTGADRLLGVARPVEFSVVHCGLVGLERLAEAPVGCLGSLVDITWWAGRRVHHFAEGQFVAEERQAGCH